MADVWAMEYCETHNVYWKPTASVTDCPTCDLCYDFEELDTENDKLIEQNERLEYEKTNMVEHAHKLHGLCEVGNRPGIVELRDKINELIDAAGDI